MGRRNTARVGFVALVGALVVEGILAQEQGDRELHAAVPGDFPPHYVLDDAAIYPRDVFLPLARRAGLDNRVVALEPSLLEIKRGMAIRDDRPGLRVRLNDELEAYTRSPEYRGIFAKWHGNEPLFWTARQIAVAALVILLALVGMVGVWRYRAGLRLQKAIAAREEEHQRAEEFQSIVDSSPDAMVLVDKDGIIERVNEQTESLFGYTRAVLMGTPVEILAPERFRGAHVSHRERFVATPRRRPMGEGVELFGVSEKGVEFPIDVNLSPVSLRGKAYVLATVRDITAHVEAGRALRKARDEAQRATAAKSRFLAAASHDLRQPLQSQSMYLGVLKRHLDDEESKKIAGRMGKSLDAMGELLDALLDISKLDTGSIEPIIARLALQDILNRVQVDNLPHAEQKGLELRVMPSSYSTRSDSALLGRIVDNFVVNAIRYTEKGRVLVGCRRHGDFVRIEVWDTGIGMPPHALESIFEEYFQLDNSARDRSKGLGLGLAIVQQLAQLLDHRVDVRSIPGKGSVFTVEVPFAGRARSEPPRAADEATPSAASKASILFVDDDPAILTGMRLLMQESGFEVATAASGEEAMARLQGRAPDILISDFRLPQGESGVDVAQRVRERSRSDLPVIILTGDTSAQDLETTALEPCRILRKPVDSDQLIELIRQMTHRRFSVTHR